MTDPVQALTVAAVAGGVVTLLFWPVRGLVWRAVRVLKATERVLIEDALKHLYDCEARRSPCTLQSLAGALGRSTDRSARLAARLEELGLLLTTGGTFKLTPDGRGYALRVIRVHRLLERALSEETGLSPAEWHAEADLREHSVSRREAERLAARLGEPHYDPHGDPIPTADGVVPPPRGKPLTALAAGETGEIVHVEDEPETVYAQLVAEGLHPGMKVRVNEVSPRRIRFEAEGEEHVLAPVVAANLSVAPLPEEVVVEEASFERLSSLEPGQQALVRGISAACRGVERRRLLDLGVVPGTVVEAELRSAAGDPTGYRIRGAVIALRRAQADLIRVDRVQEGDRR